MPAGPMLPTLLLELALFTALLIAAVRIAPRVARFLGPVAYLAAAAVARLLLTPEAAHLSAALNSRSIAWPGLIMLLAVGALAGGGRSATRQRAAS